MKRKEFNVIGLIVVSFIFLIGTFRAFPDSLASAEEEAIVPEDVLDSTVADTDVQGESVVTEETETNITNEVSIEGSINTSEEVTIGEEVHNVASNSGDNQDLAPVGSGQVDTGAIVTDEEEIYVPPVSDERQDLKIFDKDSYIEIFDFNGLEYNEIFSLESGDLLEVDPEQILDYYTVDEGRIAVTTTSQGVFLRVKLQQ